MDIQNINLIKAAKIGDLQVIKKIIKNGGNVNYICDDITALIWAAQNGHLDVVNILINNGINIYHVVKNRPDPWILNNINGQIIIAKYLKTNGYYNYANLLLDTIENGDTALTIAAKNKHPKIVERLAYEIYEQEIKQRYKFGLPTILNVTTNKNNFEVKSLQELANEVQKITTNIDFREPNPYQKLQINLKLAQLEIDKKKLNEFNKRIEKTKLLVNEINAIDLQNQTSTSNQNTYCNIL
ncbi:ankyrin repeat domain-containing protein [Spiroplasma endosymbiont of Danaus chrysippus]|uniref:ankyrin repeat domain-containing protein n=1 Tax=Spiroplasma endosymbiont of Danaus chrysippus TaxID=2691041 RepID=UPI00157A5D56|nr:ankyrin repeat domain-containing protein [Spiroplasma endosymbiont of Danaus chrysippus]